MVKGFFDNDDLAKVARTENGEIPTLSTCGNLKVHDVGDNEAELHI